MTASDVLRTRTLAIDTTGSSASAIVADGQTPLAGASVRTRSASSELVMALVDRVLTDTGTTRTDIAEIHACRGPGSFTGIRVGLATARGLARGLGVPVRTVTAFEAGLHAIASYPGPVAVLIDARRGQLYGEGFGPHPARTSTGAAVLDPVALVSWAADPVFRDPLPVAVVGSGGVAFAPLVAAAFPRVWWVPEANVASGVLAAVSAGLGRDEVDPLYLRAADAKLPKP